MIVLALLLIFAAIVGLRTELARIASALERVGRIDRCVQNIVVQESEESKNAHNT